MRGSQCSNCIASNFDCTYVEAAKKRGPPKAYVESLETRIEKITTLFHNLMPDLDLAKELESNLSGKRNNSWQRPNAHSPPSRNSTTEAAISAIRRWDISPESSSQQNAEDGEHIELADNIKSLQVDSREYRFFGKSSGAMLIKTAIDLKQEFTGRKTDMKPVVLGERRPEFWQPLPWEDNASDNSSLNYTFPEADLLASLINAYFDNVNIILPLLHRPTFERSVLEKLHYHDDMFAAIVLLDEDYDLDMPVECDDEYWEHPDPAMAFRQPPGKPSTVSAFNTFIRLNVLLSIALRTIYAINKSKILMGFGEVQWEQHIVAELDSALNRWVDSVPDHLRWDPNREDETFFSQSAIHSFPEEALAAIVSFFSYLYERSEIGKSHH
ncbi:hypothetical protein HHX47_DHR7000211 [Lentinula edodes]|nr:hypothetical protein HHX47_DHR7000211 [Lentinula edodes]